MLVIKLTFYFLISLLISPAFARPGIVFSSGQGVESIKPYRLAFSWDFGTPWQKRSPWAWHFIWESSAAIWNGPDRTHPEKSISTDLSALTTGPLLRWQRQTPINGLYHPYLELGIGLSWLSKREIEGRILSLHFQFEDKIGLGARFGQKQQYDVSLRAYHYSNASIKRPNSGVNLAMASFGVWF